MLNKLGNIRRNVPALPAKAIVKLDPGDVMPLYKQLHHVIRDAILSGDLKPGQQIPAEPELSEIYNISRITVRKAIAELADEDLITKLHGKGTFVNKRKISENIRQELSFSLICHVNNVTPSSKILAKTMQAASERDIRELQLKDGEPVLYIARLRYADEEPILFEHNYFPSKYSYLLNEDMEDRSLYDLLEKKYGIVVQKTNRSIELCMASAEEAAVLGIKKDSPLILIREVAYDAQGTPIHRTKQSIIGDKFKFTFQ